MSERPKMLYVLSDVWEEQAAELERLRAKLALVDRSLSVTRISGATMEADANSEWQRGYGKGVQDGVDRIRATMKGAAARDESDEKDDSDE